MEQFSIQAEKIAEAIRQLTHEEQFRVAQEVLRQLEEQNEVQTKEGRQQTTLSLVGSWQHFPKENTDNFRDEVKRNGQSSPKDHTGWPETPFPSSLISPEDEKNIQCIWKSPGGC